MMTKKKRKKRKGRRAGKGSSFERQLCKTLSLWWTNNKREDVFWRTSGSGARAKTRSKKGASTFGQYGDVQATDPIGQPLIDLITFEIKRGYSYNTFAGLIDQSDPRAKETYIEWIKHAQEDSKNAGTFAWFLIVRRDRRRAIVIMPIRFYNKLKKNGVKLITSIRKAVVNPRYFFISIDDIKMFGTVLDDFFWVVNPKDIKHIAKKRSKCG